MDRMRARRHAWIYVCEDLYHSFQKNSVCVELFPQFELPSASRQPSPDVFVTSLSLLCLCYSCLSSDCSQETFLEKPQGTDFLCTSGQQTVCVLLTAAVLQLLGTEGGIASQEDEEGSWTEVKAHQEKKDRDNGWARTPEQGGARGPGTPDPLSHTHLQSWPLQLPSLLSFWPPTKEDISIAPKTFENAGPEEGTGLSWCQMRAIWPVQRNRSYRKGSETSVIWANDSSHFYLL